MCHEPHSWRTNSITSDLLDHTVDREEEHHLVQGITAVCCQLLVWCYRSTWRTQGLVDPGAISNPSALQPAKPPWLCCKQAQASSCSSPCLCSPVHASYTGICTSVHSQPPREPESFTEVLERPLTSLQWEAGCDHTHGVHLLPTQTT